MCREAALEGWIKGLACSRGATVLNISQYADDTVMFSVSNYPAIEGLRFIIGCFGLLSGLRINFDKSALVPINISSGEAERLAGALGCVTQSLPIRHLGLPLVAKKLRQQDWLPLLDRMVKRLAGWSGRMLSLGGKLTLLQAVLSSVPVFYMSIFTMPKGIQRKIDVIRRRFLWSGTDREVRKPHLVSWELACLPRHEGGLGIRRLDAMNKALLAKWGWQWLAAPQCGWVCFFREWYRPQVGSHMPSLNRQAEILRGILRTISLSDRADKLLWNGEDGRDYTAKLGYGWFIRDTRVNTPIIPKILDIWRPKVPHKIKVFL
ncbi:hypothetical protein QJS10_CPB18g00804 [Acorus calamus]|uniref:Uncharacterized protein n=1 Tax=Acorus calamus TaxID=4465 RepID=A0AAV9CPB3_ACOCL|nr:hypothetical protein QJS10_CPB18g00804 [Acorus calamus]